MSEKKLHRENRSLQELLSEDFEQLVDFIEQKQILHEAINFNSQEITEQTPEQADPLEAAARRMEQHSRAMGAESLADYLKELESQARQGEVDDLELLKSINDEFEKVKDILDKG